MGRSKPRKGCCICGKLGHKAVDCWDKDKKKQAKAISVPSTSKLSSKPQPKYLDFILSSGEVISKEILLDTGSNINILSRDLLFMLKEADSDLNLFEAHETVVLADGTKRMLIGRVELLCRTTSISGRHLLFNSLFWIMEMSEDVKHSVILGNDLCKELDLLQDEVISAAEESED
ncbi:hypothetical protein ADUPG1_005742, partial [Aduncisulcus paluster]